MLPEEAVSGHVRKWVGEDRKAPDIRPFRTERHAGIIFEPRGALQDVEIVLVPGWTSLGDGLAKLGYVLARKGFRVHLLHLPGQGGPGRPEDVYAYVRDYVESLNRPVFLVGHSMGGEIIKFAADAKNVQGVASIAPAGPRRRWAILDYVAALFGPLILWVNARRLRVDRRHVSLLAPLKYMKVVRRFGGHGKGALLLGSRDRIVPLTDELYHYERGIPVRYIEVFRGGHGFFVDKDIIHAVAERIARLAMEKG